MNSMVPVSISMSHRQIWQQRREGREEKKEVGAVQERNDTRFWAGAGEKKNEWAISCDLCHLGWENEMVKWVCCQVSCSVRVYKQCRIGNNPNAVHRSQYQGLFFF